MFILTSSDNNYIQHLGVMLVSLLENCNKGKVEEIAIINDGISDENILKLRASLKKYDTRIRFIDFENKVLAHIKPKNKKTLTAFHRIFLAEFYTETIQKVLYLDCDIIVRKDITELFNTNISEYIIGAVQNDGLYYQEQLGMPKESLFFNSGILLINLTKWRENKIQQQLVSYIETHYESMLRNDQDALNAVLYKDWLALSATWNAHLYFFTSPHLCQYDQLQLKSILKDPALVHFTTQNKPWIYNTTHPFKKEYYKYLRLTAWKGYVPPDKSFLSILNKVTERYYDSWYRQYKWMRRSVKKLLIHAK